MNVSNHLPRKSFGLFVIAAILIATGFSSRTPTLAADDGGPTQIVGQGTYTFFGINIIYDQPDVLLVDASGYASHKLDYLPGTEGQILGKLTSDFFKPPFTYMIDLPQVPNAAYQDVAHDGKKGVQLLGLEVAENFTGDSYLQPVEQSGSILNSTVISSADPTLIKSGTLLVYAPDDQQSFPTSFGTDGKLFTADDPVAPLKKGYTVVNIDDKGTITFDRSAQAKMNVVETQNEAQPDFSKQTYTQAFDSLIGLLKQRYSWTELRKIDWDAVSKEYRPRIQDAETKKDKLAFFTAIYQLAVSIKDAHVSASTTDQQILAAFAQQIGTPYSGHVGIDLTQLDDKRIVVDDIAPNSPAAKVGIVLGTQVISINGKAIADYIQSLPLLSSAATPASQLLARLNIASSFPLNSDVQITYKNPQGQEQTTTLKAVAASTYLKQTATTPELPIAMPATYSTKNGYGYFTFDEFTKPHEVLAIFEDFLRMMNQNKVPAIVLDMRSNVGGSGSMAHIMESYFFSKDKPLLEDTRAFTFDQAQGKFVQAPFVQIPVYAPAQDTLYQGTVVILVSTGCDSACEFFTYTMKHSGRAVIIGKYPTAGAGGSVNQLLLPDGVTFHYTYGRSVDADGVPTIEAKGVAPTVVVPITMETVLSNAQGADVTLVTAIAYLNKQFNVASPGSTNAAATQAATAAATQAQ